jgi:hypothetical protein
MISKSDFLSFLQEENNFKELVVDCGELGAPLILFEVYRVELSSPDFIEFIHSIYVRVAQYVRSAANEFILQGVWSSGMSIGDVKNAIVEVRCLFEEAKKSNGKHPWSIQLIMQSPDWDTEYCFFMEYLEYDLIESWGAT